jgi:IS30 family transposase
MPPITLTPTSGRYLSFAEREEIAVLHAQRVGVRAIARQLGRSPSTISRELRRNASTRTYRLEYRASTAQWHAERRASLPKVAKLAESEQLRAFVQDRLAGKIARPDGEPLAGPDVAWIGRRHGRRKDRRWAKSWSFEQISNRLRVEFPDDESMRISHEAIYQALYVQGRGALRRELTACLRTGRALRVPRARTRGPGKKFVTPEIMISERPAEADDRAVPGHWEGDLILGLGSSAIGTLVERTTRFVMLLHLPRMEGHGDGPRLHNGPALAGHGAEAVRDAIAASISTLPRAHPAGRVRVRAGRHARLHGRLRRPSCTPHRQRRPEDRDRAVHGARRTCHDPRALHERPERVLDRRQRLVAQRATLDRPDERRVAERAARPPARPRLLAEPDRDRLLGHPAQGDQACRLHRPRRPPTSTRAFRRALPRDGTSVRLAFHEQ